MHRFVFRFLFLCSGVERDFGRSGNENRPMEVGEVEEDEEADPDVVVIDGEERFS